MCFSLDLEKNPKHWVKQNEKQKIFPLPTPQTGEYGHCMVLYETEGWYARGELSLRQVSRSQGTSPFELTSQKITLWNQNLIPVTCPMNSQTCLNWRGWARGVGGEAGKVSLFSFTNHHHHPPRFVLAFFSVEKIERQQTVQLWLSCPFLLIFAFSILLILSASGSPCMGSKNHKLIQSNSTSFFSKHWCCFIGGVITHVLINTHQLICKAEIQQWHC